MVSDTLRCAYYGHARAPTAAAPVGSHSTVFTCLKYTALVLVAGIALGCSPATDSPSPPQADIDTLRAALSQRDELERTYLLTSYLRVMGPEDLEAALAEVERFRVGITADEVRLFMFAWMRFDAPAAFAAARDWPTQWRKVLMEQAMHAWGFSDGRAALAEWERIEDEELQKSLRKPLVNGWATSRDLAGVTEYAATIEEPRGRNKLVHRLAAETIRDGPDAVIAWAESVPMDAPNGFKQEVLIHALGAVARVDPERAAPWYERHINQPYSEQALRNLASRWARYHDPEALVAWIETLPFEEAYEHERVSGIRSAVRVWSADAPGAVEAWLESAAPSPSRDMAIKEFVRATIEESPSSALRWAGAIEEKVERRITTFKYARSWYMRDAEAAERWLAEADIPSSWRPKIFDIPQRRPRRVGAQGTEPDE